MSIVNKAAEESIRQSRLFSQLADVSYKAVNGKRQTVRDFAKGMLNIGKLGEQMDVPKDEITKDMILDYKREQEEKLYDGNYLYQKPELPDNLQDYVPLFEGEATDFEGQKALLDRYNTIRKTFVQNIKTNDQQIEAIKKRLAEIVASVPGRSATIAYLIPEYRTKSEELAQKNNVKTNLLTSLTNVENRFREQYQKIIQIRDNIKANETERIRINDENKKLIKDYGEKFNILNRDRVSITKQPNETDEQYFQRIKDLEATTVDPNIYKDRANLEEIKKLKNNLKDILKDPAKIEDIVKSFPNPQDLYIININWKKISEFLKSKYGVNSRFTTEREYVEELKKALENVQTGTFKTVLASQPKRPGPQGRTGERGRPGREGREGREGRRGPAGFIFERARRANYDRNDISGTDTDSDPNPLLTPVSSRTSSSASSAYPLFSPVSSSSGPSYYLPSFPTTRSSSSFDPTPFSRTDSSISSLSRDEAQQVDIARVRQAEAVVQARATQAAYDALLQRQAPAIERIAQVMAEGARGLPGPAGAMTFAQAQAAQAAAAGVEAGVESPRQPGRQIRDADKALFEIVNNTLHIRTQKEGQTQYHYYFKIGTGGKIYGSSRSDIISFEPIDFRSNATNPNSWNEITRIFGNYGPDGDNMWFTIFGNPPRLADRRSHIYSKLKEIGLNNRNTRTGEGLKKRKKVIKGRGMKQIDEEKEFEHEEEIPKIADFGNKKILLNKLFYRNILSVKDKSGHSVEKLPNTVVSDDFVKMIMTAYNEPKKKELMKNIQNLEESEQELLNLLLFISGLNKNHNIDIKRSDNVKKLKDRLQLVEAQIRAGNNNPIVKKELKQLVNKLYLFGAISLNNAKDYIKQY
jgi:hypothetical protein